MNILPSFYHLFECIGTKCVNTCCAGWTVTLDSDTVHYYESQTDDFGTFIKQNLTEQNDEKAIVLTDTKRCPFLSTEGLCQIYMHYGEEHMSRTCKEFPRRRWILDNNSICTFSLSCEQVLRLLYQLPSPFRCAAEGDTEITTMDHLRIYELAQFIAWGIELLQEPSIPLGAALGTVSYVGLEVADCFKKCDFETFEAIILQAPDLLEQFRQSQTDLMSAQCSDSAWTLIFGITDTFCQVIKEAELYGWQDFLWPAHIFERNDAQRKDYLISCWNSQHPSQEHTAFFRKVAALCFMGHSLALDVDSGENIYLCDISNFILLAAVLPSTWNLPKEHSLSDYFSRLSHISRRFEQSNVIKKFVYPIIQDLFAPDLYAYASAFMVLFDNNTNA